MSATASQSGCGVTTKAMDSSSSSSSDPEGSRISSDTNTAFERSVMRRVDLRLLPLLGLLYSLALVDRTNLGVARIAGMGKDLDLSVGARYSIVSCVYFIPYILLEVPSNVVLRRVGTRNLLAFCVVAWGAVQTAMGFVPNWHALALCRVLLGAFEAGFFPALTFVITTWYTKFEVQTRLATFYLISILIGGFSAIFAYGLSFLAGVGGLGGWQWIFIIEGGLTLIFGFVAYFYLPEFPDNNTFLTPRETEFVLRRIENDRADSIPDHMTARKVLHHLSDPRVWIYALMFMCATVPAYAIGFFVTVILSGMGWDLPHSLLLSSCPYIFAAFSVLAFARLSDIFQQRALFLTIQTILTIIGFSLTGFVHHNGWRYFGLFLANAGSAASVPGLLAYASNNIVSHSKRAVTTAVIVSFGGVGGIIATTIFREQDFPRYIPGIIATISCQGLLLLLLAVLTIHFWLENRAISRKKSAAEHGIGGRIALLYTL